MSVDSSWSRDLRSVDTLTEALLRVVEAEGAAILTSADIRFLCQMVELDQSSSSESSGSEAMVSIANNYLKLASLVLEPQVASWWVGQTDDGVRETSVMFFYTTLSVIKSPFDMLIIRVKNKGSICLFY